MSDRVSIDWKVQIGEVERKLAFSTATPLAANAVYTSPTIDAINYKVTSGLAVSDQAGTFFHQYSDDGITWSNNTATASSLAANTPISLSVSLLLRYYRIVYTNGAAAQTSFKVGVYLSPL